MTQDRTSLRDHLTSRHLYVDRYSTVALDEEEHVATFFLWNLSGQAVGHVKYRPNAPKIRKNDENGRYMTYVSNEGIGKMHHVWGLETYNYRDDVLCFTEGIFDACRLHNFGIPAVATLSNNPKPLKQWLRIIPRRKLGIRDDDPAGKHFERIFDECWTMPVKDLGDCSEDEVKEIVRRIVNESQDHTS